MSLAGWGIFNRIRVEIDNSFLDEDLQDFPILIKLDTSDNTVYKKVLYNTFYNFDRIAIEYKSSGEQCPVEILHYNLKEKTLIPLEINTSTVTAVYTGNYTSTNIFIEDGNSADGTGNCWKGGTASLYKLNIDFGRAVVVQRVKITNLNDSSNYTSFVKIFGSNNYNDFNTTDSSYTSETLVFLTYINLIKNDGSIETFNIPNFDYYRYIILYVGGVGTIGLRQLEFSGSDITKDQTLTLWTKLPYYKKDEENYVLIYYGGNDSNGVNNNIILLQSDNDNNDTTFVNPFCPPQKISIHGNVAHSTTTSVIGNSSIYFDSNSYLYFNEADVTFELNVMCFNISFYIYPTNGTTTEGVFEIYFSAAKNIGAKYDNGTLTFWLTVDETTYSTTTSADTNEWTFIKIFRQPGSDSVFMNSSSVDIGTTNTEIDYETGGTFYVGYSKTTDSYFEGYIDHFHMFKQKDVTTYSTHIEENKYIGETASVLGSAVWTNNYISVYHLENGVDELGGIVVKDSTTNYLGHIKTTNTNYFLSTPIGNGYKFIPDNNAYIDISNTAPALSGTSFSVELYHYEYIPQDVTKNWAVMGVRTENNGLTFALGQSQDTPYTGRRGLYNGNWHYGGINVTPDNWIYDVFTYDFTTTSGTYYINGVKDTTGYFPHTLSGINISPADYITIAAV